MGITLKILQEIISSFPESSVQPHFEKLSFRVGKKIFATYNTANNQACLKLSAIDQSVFSAFNPKAIFPVNNKWGKQGWTIFDLTMARKDMLMDALTLAYCNVAPKKLVNLIQKA